MSETDVHGGRFGWRARLIMVWLVSFAAGTPFGPASSVASASSEPATEPSSVVTLISSTPGGRAGGRDSSAADVSDEGPFVVFTSDAGNLVSGDENGQPDVFLHDR